MKQLHPVSKTTTLALKMLGEMIKFSRISRNISQQDLAVRLGASRLTVAAIEKGSPKVSIGLVFEAATIMGISLLNSDISSLSVKSSVISNMGSLLPERAGRKKMELSDDF